MVIGNPPKKIVILSDKSELATVEKFVAELFEELQQQIKRKKIL